MARGCGRPDPQHDLEWPRSYLPLRVCAGSGVNILPVQEFYTFPRWYKVEQCYGSYKPYFPRVSQSKSGVIPSYNKGVLQYKWYKIVWLLLASRLPEAPKSGRLTGGYNGPLMMGMTGSAPSCYNVNKTSQKVIIGLPSWHLDARPRKTSRLIIHDRGYRGARYNTFPHNTIVFQSFNHDKSTLIDIHIDIVINDLSKTCPITS